MTQGDIFQLKEQHKPQKKELNEMELVSYRFHANPIKIPMAYFIELE